MERFGWNITYGLLFASAVASGNPSPTSASLPESGSVSREKGSFEPNYSFESKEDVKIAELPKDINNLEFPTSLIPPQQVALIVGEQNIFPTVIRLVKGQPVRLYITTSSKRSLCMVVDELDIKRQLRPSEVLTLGFTPSEIGDYKIYCPMIEAEAHLLVGEIERKP